MLDVSVRRLLATLVILLVIAFGLDRGAAWVAGQLADRAIAQRLDASGVSTSFEGFPFLTQLAKRDFTTVHVEARTVRQKSHELRKVTIVANDVAVADRRVTAASLQGHGLLTYDEVASIARLPQGSVSSAGDGKVAVRKQVKVLGEELTVRLLGTVSVTDGRLRLKPTSVTLPGGRSVSVSDLGGADVTVEVPLPSPVPGVTVTGAQAESDGVVVQVQGSQVSLTR